MKRKEEKAGPDPAWDLTDEPWPFDREDYELEYRDEEWQDK